MSDRDFRAAPLMTGVPALVLKPTGFIGGEPRQSTVAVGAGPAPGNSAAMYIGLTANHGQTVVAIVPENFVDELLGMLTDAAKQVRERSFMIVDADPSVQ